MKRMSEARVELASDGWVDLARSYLEEHVSEVLGTVEFSMCEVFLRPPPHLDDGAGKAAWWFTIAGGRTEVGRGDRPEFDARIEVDYEDALPLARMVYDFTDPAVVEMLRTRTERRRALGATSGKLEDLIPAELRDVTLGLHNFLAVRTA